jgi:acyl-lipid omega-6 desaturase (Delta-12 desaturase)
MAADRSNAAAAAADGLRRKLLAYQQPNVARSVSEIALTASLFALAWASVAWALHAGNFWLYALLIPPAGGLLVRLFLIQHDCGHGALFVSRAVNDWVGRVLGVVTLTPYDHWRRSHAVHHAATSTP